jgi:Protein of unknown function (DUF2934)
MLKDRSVKSAPVKPTEARSAPVKSPDAKAGGSTVVAKTAPTRTTARTAARKPAGGRPMDDLERRIQQRAYELWETEGRPQGREQDHWQQAERELAGRGASNAA